MTKYFTSKTLLLSINTIIINIYVLLYWHCNIYYSKFASDHLNMIKYLDFFLILNRQICCYCSKCVFPKQLYTALSLSIVLLNCKRKVITIKHENWCILQLVLSLTWLSPTPETQSLSWKVVRDGKKSFETTFRLWKIE